MRRVWAAVMAVWALLSLVAVLAWTQPMTPAGQAVARPVIVRTIHGRQVRVLAPPAHATTQTSRVGAQPSVASPMRGAASVPSVPAGGNN
jgi:cyanate permease